MPRGSIQHLIDELKNLASPGLLFGGTGVVFLARVIRFRYYLWKGNNRFVLIKINPVIAHGSWF